MLDRLPLEDVIRQAKSGRTRPLIVACDRGGGQSVELLCKISEGCEDGVVGLAKEVVAACVAAQLGLPVPVPFLVELTLKPAVAPRHGEIERRIEASSKVAFGSTMVPGPYSLWHRGFKITDDMLPAALAAFVFDGAIGNPDRRVGNPNCLTAGRKLWLIDHELAFSQYVIGNQPPSWKLGGLQWLGEQGHHIFTEALRRRTGVLDFGPIRKSWLGLPDPLLDGIREAIPHEWTEAGPAVDHALNQVRHARDHIDGVISEVRRVLT